MSRSHRARVPFVVKPSPIHGEGAFATRRLKAGETFSAKELLPLDFHGYNHSDNPNLQLGSQEDRVLRDIEKGEEITVRYPWEVRPEMKKPVIDETPIPMRIPCPECGELHIDEGEFATKVHHTHACQNCGMVWRPAVVPTVGVRFLPGFRRWQ